MKFIQVILFLLLLSDSAYAISPINIEVIKEAQSYGQMNAHSQLSNFLRPWISYEEKAERLNDTAEHAYLYTPFLLIATDAREKSLNGRKVELADSEKVLNDYGGILSFSVVLFGSDPKFGKKVNVVLKQGQEVIKVYDAVIPVAVEKTSWVSAKSVFRLQCYFYFLEKKIARDKPMTLSIVTKDKKEHHFYFSSANIK